jgi:hypothetical protein
MIRIERHGNLWHVIDTEDGTVLSVCASLEMAEKVRQRWIDRAR